MPNRRFRTRPFRNRRFGNGRSRTRRAGLDTALALALGAWLALASGCARPPPKFEDVPPAEDLYRDGLAILAKPPILGFIPRSGSNRAIELFQTIVDNHPYSDYAVLAELKIADAYFQQAKYEEALSYYRDFADLHPQHEKVPYTIFRSALCHESRKRSPNRDQTATREALSYLDRLLAGYPHSEYAAEGEVLWRELRTRLAENVRQIADFYLGRAEYESAAERYRAILNEFPGLGLDAEALYSLGLCYSEMNRVCEAQHIFRSIVQSYGKSDYAEDAQQRVAETNADC